MKKLCEGRILFGSKKNKSDNRGSAIVIVIIAMALIGILATTIMWSAYLNYRIKINDLKTKNSFYSAETVVEQIMAGVKKEVVSDAIGVAYQDVVSNWDSLGTDSNRESYFITAYIEAVMKKIQANPARTEYDKTVLRGYVDASFWNPDNAAGHIDEAKWNAAGNHVKLVGYNSIVLQDIRVEFYDGEDFLSIINTDIAIDVPKLRFTQAGTIDRLYPYVLIGDTGIESGKNVRATIKGSIYGGVDKKDEGGIQIGENSNVTIENASYVISGGDIVVGNNEASKNLKHQGANLIIRNMNQDGKAYQTNIYTKGLAVNGSDLVASGKLFVANDLLLSGIGSSVSLSGQYYGYGNTVDRKKSETVEKKDSDGNVIKDGDGNVLTEELEVNPANSSSAIMINGKNSEVDLTGLNTLQLAGRAYVSLPQSDDESAKGLPHVLMGESISVKSNQIAYLVPPECVGTLDGRTIIGQNPMSFSKWSEMLASLSEYEANGENFRIVDASKESVKLGGEKLNTYGIGNIEASDLGGVTDSVEAVKTLNRVAELKGIRFLNISTKQQVYLYLVMDADYAQKYFTQYYNVNSNKVSLDNYFNQYVSGGIKLGNTQGYTLVGNSMVSVTDAAGNVQPSPEGGGLVRLLSSIEKTPEGSGGEGGEPPAQQGGYQEVSDNVETLLGEKDAEELKDIITNCGNRYESLLRNLMEEEDGTEDTVFENLIRLNTETGASESVEGLQDYLDGKGGHDGKVEFSTGDGLKAVLVDCKKQPGDSYAVTDSDLRLVIAIGDVEVKKNFKGLIIASGKITIAENVTVESDGAGVYDVLQAQSEVAGDTNVPANILYNGSGMIKNGYEDADLDASGNLNIDYSKIVRYENWIKK